MIFEENNNSDISWVNIIGKIILFLLLLYFSFTLIFSPTPWIFLDGINLLIHEAGHLVFRFAGNTIGTLGGTLMQLIIPLLFFSYFLYKRVVFSILFCLFWFGDNLINISIYIKDARTMVLPLVGGGDHDWNILLSRWHILSQDKLIGGIFHSLGVVFILVSLVLMMVIILGNINQRIKSSTVL